MNISPQERAARRSPHDRAVPPETAKRIRQARAEGCSWRELKERFGMGRDRLLSAIRMGDAA